MDLNGSCDPYVVLKFATKILKTPIVRKSLHPKWNTQFRLVVAETEIKWVSSL